MTSDRPKYEVTAVYYNRSTRTYDKSKGILTITKALGELEKTADFKADLAVQYQGGNKGASRLGVKANHNEIPLHYEVTNAHGINGNVIAEEDISSQLLAIALDGTVTQKGSGIADNYGFPSGKQRKRVRICLYTGRYREDSNSGQGFDHDGIRTLIGAVIGIVVLAVPGAVYVLRRKKAK